MKFIRLFPDTLALTLSLLIGLSLLFIVYQKQGRENFLKQKSWLAFNGIVLIVLVERLWRPGVQLTLNFVYPGLLSLIWLLRLVDLDRFDRKSAQHRILLKLPFLVALIVMTITNHVGELFGFITMCVSFVVVQILTFNKEKISRGLICADISLILVLVLSYNFGELRNYTWYLTICFQLGMFFHSRDGSKIEA
jgi:hypothetical protein